MAYIKGTGTQSDPYVIHDQASLTSFLTTEIYTTCYAVLACDIDMGGAQININTQVNAPGNLDGYGHAISNVYLKSTVSPSYIPWWKGKYSRICFNNLKTSSWFPFATTGTNAIWENIEVNGLTIESTTTHTSQAYIKSSVFNNVNKTITTSSTKVTNSYAVDGSNCPTNFTNLLTDNDKYNPSKYQLDPTIWFMDGYSSPRLIPISEPGLTQIYAVKGITKIGGQGRSRRCRAHSSADFKQIATANSANDGKYLLNCQRYSDHVYVTHADDYGSKMVANRPYSLGDVVHPLTPNGYRYVCTTAGATGDTLPAEPWSVSSNVIAGTAIFSPTPVYAAETMLVVPVLYDLSTGQPV